MLLTPDLGGNYKMNKKILQVTNLKVSFFTSAGEVKAVNDVSYHVCENESIAIVGESGCGKSVTQLSVLQLVQSPPGKILGGEVLFKGKNLLRYKPNSKEIRRFRGAGIAMIFQEPMTSLNPVFTVGYQISEIISLHKRVNKKQAWDMGVSALKSVDISDPASRMNNYPFELSGGMRQRVMIAMAIACDSDIIVADEPTTALDVTTQAQVIDLMMSLVNEHNKSLVFITHNLGLVTRYTERIYVMYAGRIIESGTTEDLMTNPMHPYTIGLLNSVPKLEGKRTERLMPINGLPPSLIDLPLTCSFLPRCSCASEGCKTLPLPELRQVGDNGHFTACHLDVVAKL